MKDSRASSYSNSRTSRGGNGARVDSVLTPLQNDMAKYLERAGVSKKEYEKHVKIDRQKYPNDYRR